MTEKFRAYKIALFGARKAPGTIDQRLGDLRRYEESTGNDINLATTEDLLEYLATGYERWAPEYTKRIRGTFRSYFTWRFKAGHAETDVSADLPGINVPRRRHRRPAPEQVVLEAFERASLPERAMISLAATMGMRRTSIAELRIDARSGKTLTFRGKGGHEQCIELDDLTLHILKQLEAELGPEQTYYFPGRFPGSHLHPATVYSYVKAHMPSECLHTLRHRAGTEGFNRTRNIRAVQELLGHRSLATTEVYVELEALGTAEVTSATSLAVKTTDRDEQSVQELLTQAAVLSDLLKPHGWSVDIFKSSTPVREHPRAVAG